MLTIPKKIQSKKIKINIKFIFKKDLIFKNNYSSLSDGSVATVFGGSGFMGRYIVNALARSRMQVIVPYRGEEKAINHLKVLGTVGQIVPIPFDLRDYSSILRAVAVSDIVVNLIGRDYPTRNFSLHDVHAKGTKSIATACRECRVKTFVQFSTVGASLYSHSEWAKTKFLSECVARYIFPPTIIFRCAPIMGKQDRFLNRFAQLICTKDISKFYLLNKSDTKIQPVYANDIEAAFSYVISDSSFSGKLFEFGGTDIFSFKEFLENLIVPFSKTQKIKLIPLFDNFPKLAKKLASFYEKYYMNPPWTTSEVDLYLNDIIARPSLKKLPSSLFFIDSMKEEMSEKEEIFSHPSPSLKEEEILGFPHLNIRPTPSEKVAFGILQVYQDF